MPNIIYLRERIEESEINVKETKEQHLKKTKEEIPYEDTHEFYLENLRVYKEKLTKHIEICTKLYILMGRAFMGKKEYENAKTQFDLAQKLHTKQLRYLLPYLAEIFFIEGNYKATKAIMQRARGLELNSTLFPIVSQWKVS